MAAGTLYLLLYGAAFLGFFALVALALALTKIAGKNALNRFQSRSLPLDAQGAHATTNPSPPKSNEPPP